VFDHLWFLLLDDPASGLSEHEAERFAAQIAGLRRTDVAIVLVEHDMGFVMEQCDRVVVLDLGQVLAQGTPDDIQQHQGVRAAYLG
jgi:branched-chain amino acid transport system ATP-binding protein